MNRLAKSAVGVLLVAVAISSYIREFPAPLPQRFRFHNIRQILQKDCYSCHSNERRLAWFDQIQPGYWLVRNNVLAARAHLNFSTLGAKPPAAQKAALYEAVNMMQLGDSHRQDQAKSAL